MGARTAALRRYRDILEIFSEADQVSIFKRVAAEMSRERGTMHVDPWLHFRPPGSEVPTLRLPARDWTNEVVVGTRVLQRLPNRPGWLCLLPCGHLRGYGGQALLNHEQNQTPFTCAGECPPMLTGLPTMRQVRRAERIARKQALEKLTRCQGCGAKVCAPPVTVCPTCTRVREQTAILRAERLKHQEQNP